MEAASTARYQSGEEAALRRGGRRRKRDKGAGDVNWRAADWKMADKTGAGGYGSRSIVAVIWPSSMQPLVVGIFVTQSKASIQASDQAIARIGTALNKVVGK